MNIEKSWLFFTPHSWWGLLCMASGISLLVVLISNNILTIVGQFWDVGWCNFQAYVLFFLASILYSCLKCLLLIEFLCWNCFDHNMYSVFAIYFLFHVKNLELLICFSLLSYLGRRCNKPSAIIQKAKGCSSWRFYGKFWLRKRRPNGKVLPTPKHVSFMLIYYVSSFWWSLKDVKVTKNNFV